MLRCSLQAGGGQAPALLKTASSGWPHSRSTKLSRWQSLGAQGYSLSLQVEDHQLQVGHLFDDEFGTLATHAAFFHAAERHLVGAVA